MRRRTLAGSFGTALTLTLLVAFSVPGAAQAGDRGQTHESRAGKAALAQAEAVLSGDAAGDASMALRDLARTADGLTGTDLTHARALLARPTDPASPDSFDPVHYAPGSEVERQCGTYICVHWVEDGSTDATDPAFAQQALQLLEDIDARYRAAGYRGPEPDQGQGGDNRTDIYLADLGAFGFYGYCATDLDADGQPTYVDGSAAVAPYCVFDNDFTDFGGVPLDDLEVTAAHEYFHAVQFGYDFNDDLWVYETTATWVEDEMYDDANGNLFYLPYGQMGDAATAPGYSGPQIPLDFSGYPYGNWTWIRYLTEKYPAAQAGLPTVVRTLWENLDTTGGHPDQYSLQALDQTLASLGTSTAAEYAGFSTANRTPAVSYSEGADYPTPALAFGPVSLSKTVNTASQTLRLDHLTSGTGSFLPYAGYKGALKVRVDMAPPATGAAAIALVFNRSGSFTRVPIALNGSGTGQVQVPFSAAQVDRVEVTLVNGSSAIRDCFSDPFFQYSCGGFGVQDGRSATVRVQSVG